MISSPLLCSKSVPLISVKARGDKLWEAFVCSTELLMTCLQSRFSSAILGLSPVLFSFFLFFFCSIYSHLTLCFRKCLQVSIPDIPGTWRADLMPVLQDEKQKNFVEPIKRMTFPWPWAVLFKIEAFAAWGSLICELKSIISWPLLNHKSSLPLPSSFYLKGKKRMLHLTKCIFLLFYFILCIAGIDSARVWWKHMQMVIWKDHSADARRSFWCRDWNRCHENRAFYSTFSAKSPCERPEPCTHYLFSSSIKE